MRETEACEWCGYEMSFLPVRSFTGEKFCSPECSDDYWKDRWAKEENHEKKEG